MLNSCICHAHGDSSSSLPEFCERCTACGKGPLYFILPLLREDEGFLIGLWLFIGFGDLKETTGIMEYIVFS